MRGDVDIAAPVQPRRAPVRSPVLVLLATALPWAWFPLRDPLGLVGDVLAVVLPVLALLAAGAALVVWRRRGILPAVSVLLAGTVAVVGPWTPQAAGTVRPGGGVTVAGANVTSMTSTVPALRAVDADVLVVSEDAPAVEAALVPTYRYHLFTSEGGDVGVYSRFPLRLVEPPGPDLPGMRVAVAAPAPFQVIALHVPRPWFTGRGGYQATPAEHHRLVSAVAAQAAQGPGPVVVVGDLNSTDRARDYRSLVDGDGLVDAMRAGWAGPTQVTSWRLFLLRIDHLLVSPGWCGDHSRRFDLPRSDHVGITATIGPCSAPPG